MLLYYVVLYKQRPCSLLMKRSLPEIQFSDSQYVSATKFCWRQIEQGFSKKIWYLYKALFEDFEKSSSIAKNEEKPWSAYF